MAQSMNKVMLIGRIGNEPEIVSFEGSKSKKASFSLATSSGYRDNKTKQWVESTEWHRIVCWGYAAEGVEKYLRKGMRVAIEGTIKYKQWEKDGAKQYMTEINATHLIYLDSIRGGFSDDGDGQGTDQTSEGGGDDIPF